MQNAIQILVQEFALKIEILPRNNIKPRWKAPNEHNFQTYFVINSDAI